MSIIAYKKVTGFNDRTLANLAETATIEKLPEKLNKIPDVVTLDNLVKNGVELDVVEKGIIKTDVFTKTNNEFVLTLREKDMPVVENTYVKTGLLQYVNAKGTQTSTGLKDLSGNGNDITIEGVSSSNYVDNKFDNGGILFGQCTNVEFSKMIAMTIIMKLSI